MKPLLFFLSLSFIASGCSFSRFPLFWKTYRHPTYKFSISVPRSWSVEQDSFLGIAFNFRSPKRGAEFQANVTVVAQPLKENLKLEELTSRSARQLALLFNRFEVLGETLGHLGPIPAREIRGRYHADDGARIVRTVIGIDRGIQYVVTLSALEVSEHSWTKVFDSILETFRFPS